MRGPTHAAWLLALGTAWCVVSACGGPSGDPAQAYDSDGGAASSNTQAPAGALGCDPTATPKPTTLVHDASVWNLGVAADSANAYFRTFNPHTVWSVPLDASSAPSKLWSGSVGIFGSGVAVDADYVYWTGLIATANGVMRVSKQGGDGTALAVIPSHCAAYGGVAVDETRVYAATVACYIDVASLVSVPIGGGAATTLWSSQLDDLGGFALAGDSIVFTTSSPLDGTGAVRIVAKTGGPSTIVASSSSSSPGAIAVLGDRVFWIDGNAVMTTKLSGGGKPARFTTGFKPTSLAVDAKYVYIAFGGGDDGDDLVGSIVRVPIDGGDAQDLVTKIATLGTLTVAAGSLFWSTLGAADKDAPVRHAGVYRLDLCE